MEFYSVGAGIQPMDKDPSCATSKALNECHKNAMMHVSSATVLSLLKWTLKILQNRKISTGFSDLQLTWNQIDCRQDLIFFKLPRHYTQTFSRTCTYCCDSPTEVLEYLNTEIASVLTLLNNALEIFRNAHFLNCNVRICSNLSCCPLESKWVSNQTTHKLLHHPQRTQNWIMAINLEDNYTLSEYLTRFDFQHLNRSGLFDPYDEDTCGLRWDHNSISSS